MEFKRVRATLDYLWGAEELTLEDMLAIYSDLIADIQDQGSPMEQLPIRNQERLLSTLGPGCQQFLKIFAKRKQELQEIDPNQWYSKRARILEEKSQQLQEQAQQWQLQQTQLTEQETLLRVQEAKSLERLTVLEEKKMKILALERACGELKAKINILEEQSLPDAKLQLQSHQEMLGNLEEQLRESELKVTGLKAFIAGKTSDYEREEAVRQELEKNRDALEAKMGALVQDQIFLMQKIDEQRQLNKQRQKENAGKVEQLEQEKKAFEKEQGEQEEKIRQLGLGNAALEQQLRVLEEKYRQLQSGGTKGRIKNAQQRIEQFSKLCQAMACDSKILSQFHEANLEDQANQMIGAFSEQITQLERALDSVRKDYRQIQSIFEND